MLNSLPLFSPLWQGISPPGHRMKGDCYNKNNRDQMKRGFQKKG